MMHRRRLLPRTARLAPAPGLPPALTPTLPLTRAPRARPAAGIRPWVTLVLGLALLSMLLGACRATEGEDTTFEPLATTNTNFDPPTYITVGNEPWALDVTPTSGVVQYVAVVNRVGNPPLDSNGEVAPGTVSILENTAGALAVIQTLTVGVFPSQARWVDLDGVGSPDLVVLDTSNTRVAIFLSVAVGTWPATPSYTYTLPGTVAQLSFVNLDSVANGTLDLVFTLPRSDTVVALVNDPAGTFTPVSTTLITGLSKHITGSFDADTTADLAALNSASGTLNFYEWNGTAFGAGPGTSLSDIPSPTHVAAADFHGGDGDTDLAVLANTTAAESNEVRLYTNNGSGALTLSGSASVLERAHQLLPLGMLVGADPGPALAVMHTNQRYITVLRPTAGSFATTQLETSRNPTLAVPGDVDGDSNVDIVTVEDEKRALGIFRGDGAGAFTRTVIGLLSLPRSPHVVDVTGSGLGHDLLIVQPYEDRLVYYRNAVP